MAGLWNIPVLNLRGR